MSMVRIAKHCIRCGLCIDLCPELFSFDFENDRILVSKTEDDEVYLQKVRKVAADCPVAAVCI